MKVPYKAIILFSFVRYGCRGPIQSDIGKEFSIE